MTDLEVVNNAKNKAILRAEKAEMQLSKAKEIIKKIEKVFYSGENALKRLSKISDIFAEAEQFLEDDKPCSTTWCEDCKYEKCGLRDIGLLPKIDKE